MKCELCGSEDIDTEYHVGWDVWDGGEEDQHIDRCNTCGAWRFHFDRTLWEDGECKQEVVFGPWLPEER